MVTRIQHSLRWLLRFFSSQLEKPKGEVTSQHLRRCFRITTGPERWLTIAVDASPWGLGGVLMREGAPVAWFADEIHDVDLRVLNAERGDHRFQTTWEALALLVAVRAWRLDSHSGVKVALQSDSLSALSAAAKMSSSSGAIRKVLCELALDHAELDSGLASLIHIPGLANKWPDALSRLWEPRPQKFPYELESIPRTHVQLRTVDSFWRSLRAAGAPALPSAPQGLNRVIL